MKYEPEKYLLCGHATTAEDDGMARHVVISPAYGADWVVVYVHSGAVKRLREALTAQVEVSRMLMRDAGLDEQAILDGTAQARAALQS